MKLRSLLETWARDHNRKLRSEAWFKGWIVIALAASAAWVLGYGLWANLFFVVLVIVSVRKQPRFILLRGVLADDQVVPDHVLGMIADSPGIAVSLKRQIALHLDRHALIRFSTLLAFEKAAAEDEERLERAGGEGFRKLAAFAGARLKIAPDSTARQPQELGS